MSNAAFTSPLGPNPWLDWPCPISLEKPKLQITLTNFHCHYLPRELHPYRLDTEPGAEATIYFHEMRGFGPPPGDVGYPGDVYIDMSPGAHGLWAIRTPNGGEWTHWTPNEIIQHPHITYYYLWCSTRGEVSWYPRIVHHALSQDENHGSRDAGALIAEMLRANARRPIRRDGESAEPAPRKRLNLGKTSDTGGGNVPLSLTNGCQLLSDANEKLSQEISAHPGTRMESSGKKPSKCSDGSESINSDPMATSRLTSKVVIPSASVGGTRLDKIVASFDDILHDLLKAEQSKKTAEIAHNAQMISMLQNKEEMRAELAMITEQKAILDLKIERMKRAIAEC